MHNIKPLTFWPSAIFLFLTLMVSWLDAQTFVNLTSNLNGQIIEHLPFAFTLSAFAMVLICAYIFVSPVGKVRIGGENAQPILSPFKWFSVSLTTVIAMGILFWSVAEPVIHFNEPAAFSGALRRTEEALSFSVATLFVHWTLAPYAIYTAAGLCFALAYYNFQMPFSARSLLRPVLGDFVEGKSGQLLDSLVLFSVVIGMSATLTAGLLLIGSGITASFGLSSGPLLYGLISAFIIGVALISSFTGLRRGIQFLARINTYLFFAALVFVMATGPMDFAFQSALKGMDAYLSEFVSRHLLFDAHDEWPGWWTVAFFASWFAWAPISCLFLGKIAKRLHHPTVYSGQPTPPLTVWHAVVWRIWRNLFVL